MADEPTRGVRRPARAATPACRGLLARVARSERPGPLGPFASLAEERGQMVVELAVVAPVMIVVALVVYNLMAFLGACARFDRLVPDLVMTYAVSPAGADAETGDQAHQVSAALAEAMADENVEVSVVAESAWEAEGEGVGFSFAPHLTRYVCTMRYAPWPSSISIAGVDAGVPVVLTHERAFTVDRYRSGVVF